MFPSTFWLKNTIFFTSKKFKTRSFQLSVNMIFHAKENTTSSFFCFLCRAEAPSSSFVRLSKFPKCYGKINSVPSYGVEKYFFAPRNLWHQFFLYIPKFINSSFLHNMNFCFVQSSCFYNSFFLAQKLVSCNHFNYKAKRETESKNFFSVIFQGLKHDI